jgi:hypothetical protein
MISPMGYDFTGFLVIGQSSRVIKLLLPLTFRLSAFTLLMQIKDFKLIKGQICINLLNN